MFGDVWVDFLLCLSGQLHGARKGARKTYKNHDNLSRRIDAAKLQLLTELHDVFNII